MGFEIHIYFILPITHLFILIGKLQDIASSLEKLNSLIENKIFEKHEVEMSIKRILNDIIKEVISANILQERNTEDSQQDIVSVLVSKFAEFDVNFDQCQNKNDTRQFLHSYFDDDNYDNGRSSPIVFYQDDDLSELIEFYEDEDCNSNFVRPKSCLKRKNSPPNLNKLKINTVPQVKMIENCLLVDNFYSDDSDFDFDEDRTLENLKTDYKSKYGEYSPSPLPAYSPSPSAKKRSWASVKILHDVR